MGIAISLIVIAFVYKGWININGTLSSGDWPYLFKENIHEFPFFFKDWALWLTPYYEITAKLSVEYAGLSWEIVEKVFWFWPFIVLSFFSSYYLFRSWIGVLIYTTNTYILMVVGGGQMGVAMAYSIAPFVLGKFINLIDSSGTFSKNFKLTVIAGLILAIEVMFDPRIAYATFVMILFYFVLNFYLDKKAFFYNKFKRTAYILIVPIIIALILNSFWIISLVQGKILIQAEGFKSLSGFKFLSFADFSHAFSLLHPNWPENVFGKIYFLQPEFLILPLLAFSSFVFIERVGKEKKIIFFGFIALLGVFLSKGSNDPFGQINTWFYEHIPGMNIFRDSSKFYLLIILGYSFLIPLSLGRLSKIIPFGKLLPVVFLLFWFVLIRSAVLGELGGTFKSRIVPYEYIELKQYILSQPNATVLWIPSRQRFGFSSNSHPGISASDILGNSDPLHIVKVISSDKSKGFYSKLKKMKVEQVIVPYDSEKELFILDRKYNDLLRDKIITELDKIDWLVKIPEFSSSVVYRVQ